MASASMVNIVKRYTNASNIHFAGYVTRDVLAAYYQQCDIFVFPTLGEGYGLVLLEALSCGLPVICSDLAGGNDAITDGYNGFVFEGGNNDALKEKIEWFIQHREKISQMSKNARKTAMNYSWEHYYNKLNLAIKHIMEGKIQYSK
jgi:glycosyltransferase involved in cell wall biosynthesis